ncbi:hypothetical protein DIPPA_27012 [Diplonema papillatum]|nr:hypothetical protein DIPPA_27012 [Diplonema papillatum]
MTHTTTTTDASSPWRRSVPVSSRILTFFDNLFRPPQTGHTGRGGREGVKWKRWRRAPRRRVRTMPLPFRFNSKASGSAGKTSASATSGERELEPERPERRESCKPGGDPPSRLASQGEPEASKSHPSTQAGPGHVSQPTAPFSEVTTASGVSQGGPHAAVGDLVVLAGLRNNADYNNRLATVSSAPDANNKVFAATGNAQIRVKRKHYRVPARCVRLPGTADALVFFGGDDGFELFHNGSFSCRVRVGDRIAASSFVPSALPSTEIVIPNEVQGAYMALLTDAHLAPHQIVQLGESFARLGEGNKVGVYYGDALQQQLTTVRFNPGTRELAPDLLTRWGDPQCVVLPEAGLEATLLKLAGLLDAAGVAHDIEPITEVRAGDLLLRREDALGKTALAYYSGRAGFREHVDHVGYDAVDKHLLIAGDAVELDGKNLVDVLRRVAALCDRCGVTHDIVLPPLPSEAAGRSQVTRSPQSAFIPTRPIGLSPQPSRTSSSGSPAPPAKKLDPPPPLLAPPSMSSSRPSGYNAPASSPATAGGAARLPHPETPRTQASGEQPSSPRQPASRASQPAAGGTHPPPDDMGAVESPRVSVKFSVGAPPLRSSPRGESQGQGTPPQKRASSTGDAPPADLAPPLPVPRESASARVDVIDDHAAASAVDDAFRNPHYCPLTSPHASAREHAAAANQPPPQQSLPSEATVPVVAAGGGSWRRASKDAPPVSARFLPPPQIIFTIPKTASGLGISVDEKFTITAVQPDSPSAAAGVQPHMRLVRINDTAISRYSDITKAVQSARGDSDMKVVCEAQLMTIIMQQSGVGQDLLLSPPQGYRKPPSSTRLPPGTRSTPSSPITKLAPASVPGSPTFPPRDFPFAKHSTNEHGVPQPLLVHTPAESDAPLIPGGVSAAAARPRSEPGRRRSDGGGRKSLLDYSLGTTASEFVVHVAFDTSSGIGGGKKCVFPRRPTLRELLAKMDAPPVPSPPVYLLVDAAEDRGVAGVFKVLGEDRWNGMPVWADVNGGPACIFANDSGKWTIAAKREHMQRSTGWVKARRALDSGGVPHEVQSWVSNDGATWREDPSVLVAACHKLMLYNEKTAAWTQLTAAAQLEPNVRLWIGDEAKAPHYRRPGPAPWATPVSSPVEARQGEFTPHGATPASSQSVPRHSSFASYQESPMSRAFGCWHADASQGQGPGGAHATPQSKAVKSSLVQSPMLPGEASWNNSFDTPDMFGQTVPAGLVSGRAPSPQAGAPLPPARSRQRGSAASLHPPPSAHNTPNATFASPPFSGSHPPLAPFPSPANLPSYRQRVNSLADPPSHRQSPLPPQEPEATSSQLTGTFTSQRQQHHQHTPAATFSSQQPGFTSQPQHQQPATFASQQQTATFSSQQPGTLSSQQQHHQPATFSSQQQHHQQQESAAFSSQQPATFTSQQQQQQHQQPATFSSQQPAAFAPQQPAAFSSQQPAAFAPQQHQQQPAAFTSQQPGTFTSQQPATFTLPSQLCLPSPFHSQSIFIKTRCKRHLPIGRTLKDTSRPATS